MSTLEEYFSHLVPSELSDTICDPISYNIMVYPVFCSGRTYDRITLELNNWSDPFSNDKIDSSNLQLNLAVDSSIERFLTKHTNHFIEKEIKEKIEQNIHNKNDNDNNDNNDNDESNAEKNEEIVKEGVKSMLKLIELLGTGKRRDSYLNASRILLSLLQKNYSNVSNYLLQLNNDEKLKILSFCFERSGYPNDDINEYKKEKKTSSIIFHIIDNNAELFQCTSESKLIELFQIERIHQSDLSFLYFLTTKLIQCLQINPIRYLSNLSSSQRYEIIHQIAKLNIQFSNEESNLLLRFDEGNDNLQLVPDNILLLKLKAIQNSILEDEISQLRKKLEQRINTIDQLKYRVFITSLLPTHNTVRLISRSDPKRCLTVGRPLRCDIITTDQSAKFQEWSIQSVLSTDGRQCYVITNLATGKSIDNDFGKPPPNTIITYKKHESNPNQQWQILPIFDSYVVIRNIFANGSIGVSNFNNITLQISDNSSPDQQFSLEPF